MLLVVHGFFDWNNLGIYGGEQIPRTLLRIVIVEEAYICKNTILFSPSSKEAFRFFD